MHSITANDIKTKGISAFNDVIQNDEELMISARGKNKYIVLSLEKYNYLRECELEVAILKARNDLKNGNFIPESIEEHMERIQNS